MFFAQPDPDKVRPDRRVASSSHADETRRGDSMPGNSMIWQSPFQLDVPRVGPVSGRLVGPKDRARAAPVLFVPDDSLASSALFYPHLEDRLVKAGFAVAWLDRLSGEQMEPARELAATKKLLEMLVAGTLDLRLARGHAGLIGHGLGGGLALLAAAESITITSSGSGAVPGVVTLGSCATLDRGDGNPHARFSSEVRSNPARYSLEGALRSYPGRIVLVHGEEDFVVPIDEGERLYHWSRKEMTRFVLMDKVGHSFGAQQPMLQMTKEVDRIGKILVDFFRGLLG